MFNRSLDRDMSTWTLAHTVTGEFFSELYRSNVILAAQARKHQARAFVELCADVHAFDPARLWSR